jgi:hypothetical protein
VTPAPVVLARRRSSLAAAALVALLVLGACGGGDDDGGDDASTGGELGEAIGADEGGGPDQSTSSTVDDGADGATTSTTSAPPTTPPTPVALPITGAVVPGSAPAGIDACSQPVSYDSPHLVDGLADSAWRMPGDATGQWLSFPLDGSHRVLTVSVLPGYAKVDPCDGADRWSENRRPTSVTWRFDDGTEVTQVLADSPTVQLMPVDATTATVSLRIDGVTADPLRDFTAISEVAVQGV